MVAVAFAGAKGDSGGGCWWLVTGGQWPVVVLAVTVPRVEMVEREEIQIIMVMDMLALMEVEPEGGVQDIHAMPLLVLIRGMEVVVVRVRPVEQVV